MVILDMMGMNMKIRNNKKKILIITMLFFFKTNTMVLGIENIKTNDLETRNYNTATFESKKTIEEEYGVSLFSSDKPLKNKETTTKKLFSGIDNGYQEIEYVSSEKLFANEKRFEQNVYLDDKSKIPMFILFVVTILVTVKISNYYFAKNKEKKRVIYENRININN